MSDPPEPLEERPNKRQRTKSPSPIASTSVLPQPEANAVVASNNNNQDSTPQDEQGEGTAADTESRELTQAELDEKWRIYEMISEEYHDSKFPFLPSAKTRREREADRYMRVCTVVTELPLDYQRTFMLMKELDDEQQGQFLLSFSFSPSPRS